MVNYFKIFGLRRSGNHAIINWIVANGESLVYFHNDLQRMGVFQIEPDYLPAFDATTHVTPARFFQNIDSAVISFENRTLDFFRDQSDIYLGSLNERFRSVTVRKIIVIREYYNFMASIYMCMLNGHDWVRTRGGDISKTNLMSLYWRDYVERGLDPDSQFRLVDYDRWCKAPGYRNELANQLDFENRDVGVDQVSPYGLGSSFHGVTDTAKNFAVSERWKTFADNDEFRSYLHRDVIRDQYLRLHGETEAYKYFNK